MKRLVIFAVCCSGLAICGRLGAQPVATAPSSAPTSFKQLFTQWKAMLAKMRGLQEKYQLASARQRTTIEAEFNQLREQGRLLAPKLLAAAEAAYQTNPSKDKAGADFLMATVAENVRGENYEEAARIGKLLIKNGYEGEAIDAFTGYALFVIGDFAEAKKLLSKAKEKGKIGLIPARNPEDKSMLDTLALEQVDHELELWNEEEIRREAEAKADDLPRVKLTTTQGDIVLELFENEAPNSVANFISLVEKGYYNGLKFHRVIGGFMAQGGDPKGDGTGGPGYTIACECTAENHRNHFRGTLSMAHAGPNTGGSQFFLTFAPTPMLDGKHTVFGRIIEGMDVLAKLQRTEGTKQVGSPDKIVKAEVLRKRDHEYVPVKN